MFKETDLFLVAASVVAGALNSVAGGGSFITFPTLLFTGVPPLTANASNTVALFPGSLASAWAYRHEFATVREVSLKEFVAICSIGGVLGAWLLVSTPENAFVALIPYLMLFATGIFLFGQNISELIKKNAHVPVYLGLGIQFIVAVYGGYFGGGAGIVTLAILSILGMKNIHSMNALKSLSMGTLNAIAVVIFTLKGAVDWRPSLIMMGGAILGGYLGARVAGKVTQAVLRKFIGLVGLSLTIYFFLK